MPRQTTINFSSGPRPHRPVHADKAPKAEKPAPSREDANTPIASHFASLTPPSSYTSVLPPTPPEPAMDSSFDLPDSTDWIPTSLPAFEPLEAALRCEVCKDFYDKPVITSCSHTFCSICIRRCLSADGKCPACRTACQADKLVPNIAVREIVARFQDARPRALELARRDREGEGTVAGGKKRKIEETDLEEEAGEGRRTRARQTKTRSGRREGVEGMPVVIPDSEDEGDEEFLPAGMVKCPICGTSMKEAAVYSHLDVCPGTTSSAGRNTRSRKNTIFPNPLQNRPKEPSPAPSRLPGLNYAMMKESVLRKKLSDLGIPNWGSKTLLLKRHQEWLHLYNSNCDASEDIRKTKKELLRDLDEWERTQGGHANAKESHIMKKDFDGLSHASTHKSQFDDLIANARKKRAAAAKEEKEGSPPEVPQQNPEQNPEPQPAPQLYAPTDIDASRPYENNEAALSSIRDKVEEANRTNSAVPPLNAETIQASEAAIKQMPPVVDEPEGFPNPFSTPTRKVPMFAMPEEPVMDVDNSTTVQ